MSGLLDPGFLARLERLDFLARKVRSGEMRGDVSTRRGGAGSMFRDHKSYTQGDDLRFLDWNVYSRLGELLIKQFDAEENLSLLLVVDASGSMDFGDVSKHGVALRVAAALGFIALSNDASVSLHVAPEASGVPRRTFFGRARVPELLGALEAAGVGGEIDLDREARAAIGRRRGRGIALVISDFFDEHGYGRALRFMRHAGYRVGAIHVLDRRDLEPELEGRVRLVDIETRRGIRRLITPRMREDFTAEVRRWCDGVERFCRSEEIAYVRVDTAWPLERIVRGLIFSGGVLR